MQKTWNRIETWLAANVPEVLESLRPGASGSQIAETEAYLGVTFPDAVRASYRIHDGQSREGQYGAPGFIEGWELLSLDAIRWEWQVWKDLLDNGDFDDSRSEPEGPILTDWWNPRWIPLTHDGSGNHHMLDLSPAPGGNVGQIIQFWHDEATRDVLAPAFAMWLGQFADALEAGEYGTSDEYHGLVRTEDIG